MKCKHFFLSVCCAFLGLSVQAQVTIDVDAQQRGPKVSPMLYGIFYEDINHAADGGLYAELIRNRSFEDGPRYGAPADMQGWSTYAPTPSQLTAKLIQPSKKTPLLNAVQHNALELDIKASSSVPVLLVNKGYWGINAVQGRTYRLSFWAKTLYNNSAFFTGLFFNRLYFSSFSCSITTTAFFVTGSFTMLSTRRPSFSSGNPPSGT